MAKEKKTKAVSIKDKKAPAIPSKEYAATLADLKKRIREAQIKAANAANRELLKLYWSIGKTIIDKQEQSGWGSNFIEKLAKDLQNEFPGIEGFSRSNLFRMRAFYTEYTKVAPAVRQLDSLENLGVLSQLPWSHNVVLMEKLDDVNDRLWYAHKAIENGWSRNVMAMWIKSEIHNRQGKAITNFKSTLPTPHSDLANQSLKDPYLFDFLTLRQDHNEKEIEQGLVDHVRKFLMELGSGFAFVGQQYPIEVSGKTYKIDLLLYNFKLRRFFVVEIKARAFDPRDTGQTNFYLSAIDDLLKHSDDQPTIGLILCKTKDNITAEYALRNLKSPIGVAGYEIKLVEALPKELKGSLPSIKEIEAELEKDAKQK
jgi:predicted nuclease of restriction endonuclease-like (RecB) superfamily